MSQSERPKILFLNRSYWPDSEATGQLLTSLCEGLATQFDVHVLAGLPNAAFDSNWEQVTTRNGVTIHRVQHLRLPKNRMSLKALNFLSFVKAADKKLRQIVRPDVVVFETDPFLLPFAASRLQKACGCRMIGYLQDIYPDVAVALGKVRNSWPVQQLRKRLFNVYRRCDQMVLLSEDMRDLLTAGGVAEDKCSIIPNWVDTDLIRPIPSGNLFRQRYELHDNFLVMYSGNLGLTQKLEDFVAAAALLREHSRIQFVFAGRGATKTTLEKQVADLQLNNVLFCDYQPLDELSHSLGAADLHLIPLSHRLYQCLMPSKLYGVLAAGKPFLTTAPANSELCRIAVQQQVGFSVDQGSPTAIAQAILQAMNNPDQLQRYGENARRLAERQYSQQHAVNQFAALLESTLSATADSSMS